MAEDGFLLSSTARAADSDSGLTAAQRDGDSSVHAGGHQDSGSHGSRTPGGGMPAAEAPESEATIEGELTDSATLLGPVETGYDLGALLGRGGEGEVRAAIQRAFGRTVAIKRVRRDALDEKRLRRFRSEALITALLEHPHIVPIYDFRVGETGELHLIMKQVVGTTWRDLLRPKTDEHKARADKLSRDDHLDILLKVCDAVSFAHARGFLHRDLKPENIMVGEHGEVLVMDWGCAVSLRRPSPNPVIPTIFDLETVSGTPAFMPPEQSRNDKNHIGPVSDVYLLGGMLYQYLTRRAPHRGKTVQEVMAASARGEVIPPAERIGKPIDEELSAIAMAALDSDPSKRTPTVAAFAAALRGYRRHAEALQLLRDARKRLQSSKRETVEAEEAFRKALSSCEQAIELWPEHRGAHKLLLKTSLLYADHALHHNAFRVARTMANTATNAAKMLGYGDAIEEAVAVNKRAVRGEAESRSRERTVRNLRFVTTYGGMVAAVALAVGFVWAWSSSSTAQTALSQAKTNLDRFEIERSQRIERELIAVPALVSQARELAAAKDFAGALTSIDAVLSFEPGHSSGQLQRSRILIVLDRRDEAAVQLQAYIKLAPDDKDAQILCELCVHGGDDPKTQQALADVFLRQGASAEAEALFTGVDQREAVWRKRLDESYKGFKQEFFKSVGDGTFALTIPRNAIQGGISSLEPLVGIPLSNLDLRDERKLRDLAPLSGGKLVRLKLNNCGIRDISPLLGHPLQELELTQAEISDLSPLKGMALEALDLSYNPVSDLSSLAGMPLRKLSLWNCKNITDLSPLRNARLEWLSLGAYNDSDATHVVSLYGIEGQPIAFLDLRNVKTITDFTSIARIRPKQVLLDGTRIDDLGPLWSLSLNRLSITNTQVMDISPIAKQPLDIIDFPMTVTRGLTELRQNQALTRINGLAPSDFWALRDIGQKLADQNPRFGWDVRGTLEGGVVVNLEISRSSVSELAPLKGLPLYRLIAWGNAISDGRPLRGMPLREVHLDGNPLTDIAWLDKSPINNLHINGTKVSDLSPLKGKHIRVLHVADSGVRDLRPILAQAPEELVFTPAIQVEASLKGVRNAKDIKRLGVAWNRIWPVEEFWRRYDAGEFK